MKCWFCEKTDDTVVDFAFVESKKKPVFAAHPGCVTKSEAGDSLIPIVTPKMEGAL